MALGRRGLDAAEVRRLVEAHYDDVFAYCRRHCGSAEEAEDASQEVFLRFVRAVGRYRDAGKPLAYLLTIARNVCADMGRARARACDELPSDEVLAAPGDSALEGSPAHDAAELRRALDSLGPDAREVLELRFYQELSLVEIARVMGISRFAARRRLDAVLGALREKLDSRGGGRR